MTEDGMIALVDRYFAALDARDPDALAATLTEDCTLTIETHGIRHEGREAIRSLFAGRWTGSTLVRHHDFSHVPFADGGRVASQFTVTYTHPDGTRETKSNANFFTIDGACNAFSSIAVYMAGDNTIRTGN